MAEVLAGMKVVMPGGSGQVGQILTRHLRGQGHVVSVFSLRENVERERLAAELEAADVCINLAGRSVNCRYGEANRHEIYESRVKSTRLLNELMAALPRPPRVWINASTATIYRHALDRNMNEATGELGGDEPGAPSTWNFSIRVAKAWEEAFFANAIPGTRKIAIRSAMTFSPDKGGVFDVFLALVRYGLGGPIGPGTQYVSWIHEADFTRAIDLLIAREDLSGVVNLASPNPLPNCDFMEALRRVWGTGVGLPAPGWMLEIGTFLMRTESELVLKSRRVVPGRLQELGFEFTYPEWAGAAEELVARWRLLQKER